MKISSAIITTNLLWKPKGPRIGFMIMDEWPRVQNSKLIVDFGHTLLLIRYKNN